jgi:hypothetical protein
LRTQLCGLGAEHHTDFFHSFVLFLNVVDCKGSQVGIPDDADQCSGHVKGIPCLKIASWNVLAAELSFGSRSSWVPSGSWGETTVNHLNFPAGMSIFLNEAQNLGIEPERFVLVVDENASKTDFHKIAFIKRWALKQERFSVTALEILRWN